MNDLKAVVEALLFASDFPLTPEKIVELFKDQAVERSVVSSALSELKKDYESRGGGISLHEVAGGYQFRTRPDFAPWIKRLKGARPALLSPAALETLAVIAYRQPVAKAELDLARGVDVGGVLKGLLERKLVRIVGRKEVPGRPMLYGTTRKFLEVFNLQALSDLPTMREFTELQKQNP